MIRTPTTTSALATVLALAIPFTLMLDASATEPTSLKGKSPHFGEDGWDVSLGAGAVTWDAPFYIGDEDNDGSAIIPILDATYQKGRFYFAANDIDGLIFAYTIARDQDWVLDAGFAPGITGVDFSDIEELKHLQDRDIDGLLGLRVSHYGDHSRLSLSAGVDVLGAHDGAAASAEYFYEWQLKNWLFTGSAEVAYLSDKAVNHMVGVSTKEATASLPAYQADAGYSAALGLKAEYPVTEDWIFTSSTGIETISDAFKDSPITESDIGTGKYLMVGMKYQF